MIARVLGAALVLAVLAGGGYGLKVRGDLAAQRLELVRVTTERDNLRSELSTARERLAQSQRAQGIAVSALQKAQAASTELASIKDWIRGNEDAPVPAWFDDLLVRLGFGLRDPAAPGPN